jgi:hypothetical protein
VRCRLLTSSMPWRSNPSSGKIGAEASNLLAVRGCGPWDSTDFLSTDSEVECDLAARSRRWRFFGELVKTVSKASTVARFGGVGSGLPGLVPLREKRIGERM